MTELWLELSGENPALAAAEALAVTELLGGRVQDPSTFAPAEAGLSVELPSEPVATELIHRLALARRGILPRSSGTGDTVARWITSHASAGGTASFRPVRRPTGADETTLFPLVDAWKSAGGTIDLRTPSRRFWYSARAPGACWLGEELATSERGTFRSRRMPTLPFRKPVSLPPPLARVAANLGRVRSGDRVVDPFVGTGALLAEAGLLGGRISGADLDAEMVRGALANLAHLGRSAELLKVADAGTPFPPASGGLWDALVTDPPYGRASGTRGEAPEALVVRAMRAWAEAVRPGGHLSIVTPTTAPSDYGPLWEPLTAIPNRVHRSLTREFRVYRRVR